MGRLTVAFRKRDTHYFSAGEPITADEPIAGFDEQEVRLLADHPRMRRIMFRPRPGRPLHRYYLHWSGGTGLASLDRRVAAGAAAEQDFAGALQGSLAASRTQSVVRNSGRSNGTLPFPCSPTESSVHALTRTSTSARGAGARFDTNVLEFITPETS